MFGLDVCPKEIMSALAKFKRAFLSSTHFCDESMPLLLPLTYQ